MLTIFLRNTERNAAVGCLALGLLVAVTLSPKDAFFLPNAAFFWISQLAVLAVLWIFRPRAAVIAGTAVALAAYLAMFGTWLFSREHPESMAWAGYVFSLPGALVGAIVAAGAVRSRPGLSAIIAGSASACAVLAGVIINQVAVCSTVMYCLGK